MKIWAKIGQNGDHHLRWWGPISKNESWLILTSKEIYFQKMIKTKLIFTKFAQIRTSNSTPLPQLQCCYHRFLPWTWTFPVPQLWKSESSQKSHNLDTDFQHCSWGRGVQTYFFLLKMGLETLNGQNWYFMFCAISGDFEVLQNWNLAKL